jgi:hypothetical protein
MTDLLILQAQHIQETNPELTFEECKQIASEQLLEWANDEQEYDTE